MNFAIYSAEESTILMKQWSFQEWHKSFKKQKQCVCFILYVSSVVSHLIQYSKCELNPPRTKAQEGKKKKALSWKIQKYI